MDSVTSPGAPPGRSVRTLRPWQRLGVRLAALFAPVTLLAVVLVGVVVHERQKHELEDAVGTQLLNIARIGALLVDRRAHTEAETSLRAGAPAYVRVQTVLTRIRDEAVLPTPIYTLALEGPDKGARLVVTTEGGGAPGMPYPVAAEVAEPLSWTFEDGVARYTRIYRNARGTWISAFAPVGGEPGKKLAVLVVDYPLEIYLDRLRELRIAILEASVAGAVLASILGLVVARRITRPVSALTRGATRVAEGDLSQALPVQTTDEIGVLTRAFNGMLEGLRQRDFIRNTFGRYVSPEVARAILDSPEGLRLGGGKRVVTILMSDLRGYTRFAEQGDPAWVMEVLNGYLARMTDIVVEHGGTINEFIGDAIFAVFGAPIPHADHAERAAATALAMQRAMTVVNAEHVARGLPRFEMGIGVNTGEAVVGNIGSEQRAKYAVVGSAVNVAARIEGATVGGQIFLSAATYEQLRDLADVLPPLSLELKGLTGPLQLYELRGLRGRFAQQLPEPTVEDDAQIAVTLPVTCSVIEGKAVSRETIEGTVVRLGRAHLAAALAVPLPPFTNVRLRLSYRETGHDSGDLYGKVMAQETRMGRLLTIIRLTSVDAADQQMIEMLLAPSLTPTNTPA
jgi:class 3 adenylate cyclase